MIQAHEAAERKARPRWGRAALFGLAGLGGGAASGVLGDVLLVVAN